MFGKRNRKQKTTYDKTGKIPVIRASICTREKVAGFKDEKTGK
ncbi:MAG TPA: aspartate dehydrogenase, partial [Lachnospiraceae bacterium]|nr:aspartate dehydrogenase [Lachnospiraceae bacterium]